jgi:hypothetical protein
MYNKLNTLADKPEEIVMKMKAHRVRHQPEVDLESIKLLALAKTQMKIKKRNSKHTRKSRKSRDSGTESDGSSLESEKHRRRRTQECYRCHQVGHIARHFASTAPEEITAPTETAAAATTMATTSIENCLMTVMSGESPSKESWYLDCTTTSHLGGDPQRFKRYTEYTTREGQEIRDYAGGVTGKAIGHGDVRLRLRLPGGHHRIKEVVVKNVLHVEGAHTWLSQSQLMDWVLWNVPVNGYGIKIYNKAPAESTGQGPGNPLSVARQIGGLFQLDVKVAGNLHRSRETKRQTAPYAADEHFYRKFLVPEEPQQVTASERIVG